jgi:mono/diheme cytochrome c family protein
VKRVVDGVQVLALVTAAVFVVLLFANEPDTARSSGPVDGAILYSDNCAGCHGPSGSGGVGPSFVGIVERYPEVSDEIAVVTDGRGSMPAWADHLTAEEIAAVVEFTRTGL